MQSKVYVFCQDSDEYHLPQAVIFICDKSVQGRVKLIQFRFICNRTVWILYLPMLQWSSSSSHTCKANIFMKNQHKDSNMLINTSVIGVKTPSHGNRNVKSIHLILKPNMNFMKLKILENGRAIYYMYCAFCILIKPYVRYN